MKICVFQFNGCNKCLNETILLPEAERILEPSKWSPNKIDIAIITGYLVPEDKKVLETISSNTKKIIAFGSCATSGGVYGLAYQKGHEITPLNKLIDNVIDVQGCLGEIEELESVLKNNNLTNKTKLCESCNRKSTCDYLDEVYRVVDITEDEEACYNDLGLMCMGYIANKCKELCVNQGAPCRGCKPNINRPGFRMISMFGTLMGNIEVATEATGKGGTDKLADEDDDVTDSILDITGNFFRFTLANTVLPIGKIQSSGNIISDIFIGRPIEELPMILGLMGGSKAISMTLHALESFEAKSKIEVSEEAKAARNQLLKIETNLNDAIKNNNSKKYEELENEIRNIAGNMNLSKLFFGGFRTDEPKILDLIENGFELGPYESGPIKYKLNTKGIITEFSMEV